MGKASRWLKSLLGMKKGDKQSESGALPPPNQTNKKDRRRRWSFTHSTRNTSVPPSRRVSLNIPTAAGARDASWPRTKKISKDDDSDKHAVQVAAATAAAAEAAVTAAQAAMAVVRLTSRGSSVGRHPSAAVKIQTVFRGYLARKALKALKALVKLQAHVRGFLVRKRATATLHGMQALIRAQSTARAARLSSAKSLLETQPTLFEERLYETRSEVHSSRRVLSDPYYDDTAKIVEIDTYYTKPKTRRPNNAYAYASEYGDHDMRAFPIPRPTTASFSTPTKLSVPSHRYEWGPYENYDNAQSRFHRRASSTAHSTPRFTPVKPVCDEGPFRQLPQPAQPHRLSGSYHPNYMASTQSFEAKSRSQSAPKQRPTTQPSPSKKRMPLEKVMECRRSLSGVKMNRSYSGEAEEGPHY